MGDLTWFKVFAFILCTILEVADFISDWLFYVEMSKQEKGIVFGPIDKKILYAILAFCCIGIVTLIVQMFYYTQALFTDNKCCIDFVYLSTLDLYCEELPQIGLSAYIASCREESTSLIQLIKASFLIAGCIVRITTACRQIELHRKHSKEYSFFIFSFILILGSILAFLLSLSIFVFSNIEHDDWSFKFQASTELETSGGDPSRFFGSAGIFINGADLHNGSFEQSNLNDSTWLKMTDLSFLMTNPSQLQKIKFHWEEKKKILIQTFVPTENTEDFQKLKAECYKETDELLFMKVDETECLILINREEVVEIWIHFIFLPLTRYRLMGDVQYNACHVTSDDCSEKLKTCSELNLKYFSEKSMENIQYHLNPTKINSLYEFYTSDNLIPTKDAWKTGFGRCKSSGFESPNWYTSIAVNCLN